MIKQMMKLAGARNERDFLKMFPTEASFLKKYGGEMMYMYGGSYQEGGMAPEEMMPQQGGAPMQPQGGGGEDQAMQQIVQLIVQALQQGVPEQEILAKLVEMTGMPEEQAMQIIQLVVQKMSGGAGQQMPPEEQMMQQAAPQQAMKMGGTPCYECGGKYKNGGSYSGTYSNGVYYRGGGPYVPEYGEYAYGGNYPMYTNGSMSQYRKGGEYDMTEEEIQDLMNKGYKIQYL